MSKNDADDPMSKYDDLFESPPGRQSVFADKGALDPLAEPETVVARGPQEDELARILRGVREGFLPPTVSVHGPPGTGKTLTTRRLCQAFADRTPDFDYTYVNLTACRTVFGAANEVCFELTGERRGAYEGLDGVFEAIWTALEGDPEWVVLVLDEVDQVRYDSNYEPSEFFYRLLRGEGRLSRGLHLSTFLLGTEPISTLQLDGRVRSAMSDDAVYFPPYTRGELYDVLAPRVDRAFRGGALPEPVFAHGVGEAARRWGDARKALRLFRRAGEVANERGLRAVARECVEDGLETAEQEAVTRKLLALPFNHFTVLNAAVGWTEGPSGDIKQPVTTREIHELVGNDDLPVDTQLGERAVRSLLSDLETMGLVETWIESRGRDGRVKLVETTFDPQWVRDAIPPYVEANDAEIRSYLAGE